MSSARGPDNSHSSLFAISSAYTAASPAGDHAIRVRHFSPFTTPTLAARAGRAARKTQNFTMNPVRKTDGVPGISCRFAPQAAFDTFRRFVSLHGGQRDGHQEKTKNKKSTMNLIPQMDSPRIAASPLRQPRSWPARTSLLRRDIMLLRPVHRVPPQEIQTQRKMEIHKTATRSQFASVPLPPNRARQQADGSRSPGERR